MTKILRNALLATVAVAGLASSAFAQQTIKTGCGHMLTSDDDYWTQSCLGGDHDHDHGRSHGGVRR